MTHNIGKINWRVFYEKGNFFCIGGNSTCGWLSNRKWICAGNFQRN